MTGANDDQYFVFEDLILQIMLCFSRDTEVIFKFTINEILVLVKREGLDLKTAKERYNTGIP